MQRKRLASLRKALELSEPIGFCPKKEDVQAWYRLFNRHIFDDILSDCPEIYILNLNKKKRDKNFTWANTTLVMGANGQWKYWLELNNRFPSMKYFLDILAHEMIHLYQIQYEAPEKHNGRWPKQYGHGKSFEKWRPKFEKLGLAFAVFFPYVYEIKN